MSDHDKAIAAAATAMLHKVTNPLVVAAIEKADPTPTEAALIEALDATADLAAAWSNKAKAAATEGPNSSPSPQVNHP